jgi:hypothetical protein
MISTFYNILCSFFASALIIRITLLLYAIMSRNILTEKLMQNVGKRIVLPGGQNLPVLSSRVEKKKNKCMRGMIILALVLFSINLQAQNPNTRQEISWLPAGNKNSLPAASEINKMISQLTGTVRVMVCRYDGSKLVQNFEFSNTVLNIKDTEWRCIITKTPDSLANDGVELNVAFRLVKGKMTSSGVAVAFDFADWSTDNYVMIPASVYNGNRNKIEHRGYCTGFEKDDFYNKDIPQITTDLPQLSPVRGAVSRIEVSSCNAATPAMCLYNRKSRHAFIVLTEQGIRKGDRILDNGFVIEESLDRSKASFIISAPGVRERKPEFIGFGDSPDRGINLNAGDEIVLKLRIFSFTTQGIPGLLDKFMTVRKSVTGENQPRELVPFSEIIQLMTKQIDKRWLDNSEFKYYCPENSQKICIGWVGGLMNTFPMLVLNDKMHRDRVISTFDFAIPAVVGKSGYFLAAMNPDGTSSGRDWFPNQPIVLTRQNADALFWMLKQFMILKAQGNASVIKSGWEQSVNQLARAFVNTWKKHGQWGNYLNHETGDIAVYNTTSGATAIGGLALASGWFHNPEYMEVAKEAAGYYYNTDFVQKGFTYGACSDILQNADSETAAGLMTSLMTLYETTGDKKWLDMSRNAANLAATWVVSYDYELPKETELGQLNAKLAGVVWASTQNKHGAPGFCTSSGDPLFKIYRSSGDLKYAELMRDVVRAWAEGIKPSGAITERLTYCDADNRGSRGGDDWGSVGWNELNGILMAMELPGIYLRTDKDELVVFDHVKVSIVKRDPKGLTLNITNHTKYNAHVSILAENAEQIKIPVGYTAFMGWPKVTVKSDETKTVEISPDGRLQNQ